MYYCLLLALGMVFSSASAAGFMLHATCDNNMKIFADTNLLITDNDWTKTSEVEIPENTKSIEIHCYDSGFVGGILASFDNGLKTDGTWSCSADDGSTWNPAYEIGNNGMSPWGVRPQISTGAKWIWTGKDTYHGKHKNVICKISLACDGKDSGCCTASNPCGLDDGDCDSDKECEAGLVCGTNNCPNKGIVNLDPNTWDRTDDCCTPIAGCSCSDDTETAHRGKIIGQCVNKLDGKEWCYVKDGEQSKCQDKKPSRRGDKWWSFEACNTYDVYVPIQG